MGRARVLLLTTFAMVAFAGNSLLCRLALRQTQIGAGTFTAIRISSGALTLWIILMMRGRQKPRAGSWISAMALFGYAASFSLAYVSLPAATGAILLFGSVQATMIGYGLARGERLGSAGIFGLLLAFCGLVGLLLPGLSAPPLAGAVLMISAGAAWGIYSLRGRGAVDPVAATAGNFLRAVPFALAFGFALRRGASLDRAGILYAVASGAITSGMGYAVWYSALRGLTAATAATVQLSVPVLAAAGAILFLGETLTPRYVVASIAILGGIAAVVLDKRKRV